MNCITCNSVNDHTGECAASKMGLCHPCYGKVVATEPRTPDKENPKLCEFTGKYFWPVSRVADHTPCLPFIDVIACERHWIKDEKLIRETLDPMFEFANERERMVYLGLIRPVYESGVKDKFARVLKHYRSIDAINADMKKLRVYSSHSLFLAKQRRHASMLRHCSILTAANSGKRKKGLKNRTPIAAK